MRPDRWATEHPEAIQIYRRKNRRDRYARNASDKPNAEPPRTVHPKAWSWKVLTHDLACASDLEPLALIGDLPPTGFGIPLTMET